VFNLPFRKHSHEDVDIRTIQKQKPIVELKKAIITGQSEEANGRLIEHFLITGRAQLFVLPVMVWSVVQLVNEKVDWSRKDHHSCCLDSHPLNLQFCSPDIAEAFVRLFWQSDAKVRGRGIQRAVGVALEMVVHSLSGLHKKKKKRPGYHPRR